jgi:hypothetical protein
VAGAAHRAAERQEQPAERMDTLAAWPPEATRVLRSSERVAFSTLKLALPGYMILAQVPIARFLNVPSAIRTRSGCAASAASASTSSSATSPRR